MTQLKKEMLNQQLEFRQDSNKYSRNEIACIIMKPGYLPEHLNLLDAFTAKEGLNTIYQAKVLLSEHETIAIYNEIFRFKETDILFGLDWKKKKLEYMLSGYSLVKFVRGNNAQALCESFKHELRQKYGKLSIPDEKLSDKEFGELAIKNLIHVVDRDESEVAIWLLA